MHTVHLATGTLDLQSGTLQSEGAEPTLLSQQERDLIAYLATRANQDVSRDELLSNVMGYASGVNSRAVDHAIKRLRSKVEKVPARPFHLVGVRGVGYRFVPLADNTGKTTIVLGDAVVDLDRLHVQRGEEPAVALSAIEGRLLEVLLSHRGKPVPTTDLLRDVWGVRDIRQRRIVDKLVYRLRAKLEATPTSPVFLKTVRGRGLLLDVPATEVSGATPSPAASPTGVRVPAPLGEVFGRQDLTETVRGMLGSAGCLVTLHGPAGVGKSTLATAILADRSEGCRYADLAHCDDTADVLEGIAKAFGVDHGHDGEPTALWAALADATQRTLLVEHAEMCLPAAAEALGQVRSHTPGLRVLVTSRHPLGLAYEQVVAVEPLAQKHAKALLLARAAVSGVHISPDESGLDDLIEQVDRLPLALELAAGRLRLLGLDGVLARMGQPLTLFRRASGQTGDARLHSLRSSLAQTWEALQAQDQHLLAATTVFQGSFSLEAAESVLGPLFQDGVVDGLQRLLDFSVLRRHASGRLEPFHGVTELILDERSEQVTRLRERCTPALLNWYAGQAQGVPEFQELPPESFARIEPEIDGALATLRQASNVSSEQALTILGWCITIRWRLGRQAATRTMLPTFQRHLQRAGALDRAAACIWVRIVANLRPSTHELKHVHNLAMQARETGDIALEAYVLGQWLYSGTDRGLTEDVPQTVQRLTECLPHLYDLPSVEATARCGLGWHAFRSGDLDNAWSHLQEALGLARYSGDPWLVTKLARDLAGVAHAEGRLHEAEAFIQMAQRPLTSVPGVWDLRWTQDMQGLVWLEQGRIQQALDVHEALLLHARETGRQADVATQANRLGTIEGLCGSPATAATWFELARACQATLGNRSGLAASLYNLGECARQQGRTAAARALYQQALDMFITLGRTVHQGVVLGSLGRLALESGDWSEADTLLRTALEHLEQGRARRPAAEVRTRLGLVVAQSDPQAGAAMVREAVAALRAIGPSRACMESMIVQANLALVQQDPRTAQGLCVELAEMAVHLRMHEGTEVMGKLATLQTACETEST